MKFKQVSLFTPLLSEMSMQVASYVGGEDAIFGQIMHGVVGNCMVNQPANRSFRR